MKPTKLPRKIKKGLKRVILKKTVNWRMRDVKIIKAERSSRKRFISPTFKNNTVTYYTLG